MRWIKDTLLKIWKFIVWAITVQEDEPEDKKEEEIFDIDYFSMVSNISI